MRPLSPWGRPLQRVVLRARKERRKAPRAAARVASGDPCDRPGGCFASLVIRRAAFAMQASTSHGSDMKASCPC